MAQGLFNNDVHHDLAVANYLDNTITILLGNSDGTFAASLPIPVGTGPSFIVAADFNGDGFIDLAVANSSGNSVMLFLETGMAPSPSRPGLPLRRQGLPVPLRWQISTVTDLSILQSPIMGRKCLGVSRNRPRHIRNKAGLRRGFGAWVHRGCRLQRDGKIDVATSDFTAGTVSVLTFGTIAGAAVTNNASDDGNSTWPLIQTTATFTSFMREKAPFTIAPIQAGPGAARKPLRQARARHRRGFGCTPHVVSFRVEGLLQYAGERSMAHRPSSTRQLRRHRCRSQCTVHIVYQAIRRRWI